MNKWLVRQGGGKPLMRLYCFSYAGGNAMMYRPWQQKLDPRIEVVAIQLPGRGMRMTEPLFTDMQKLVPELTAVIMRDAGTLPFAFFGHSLGSMLSFEITRYCHARQLPMPVHAFFSGCSAPQMRNPSDNMHLMSDHDLMQKLKEYNGTPPAVLANQELMELVLPMIRADFSLVETWKYRSMPLLAVPISVLAGKKDDRSSDEQVQGWQRESSGPFAVHWFEGDHFFIHGENEQVRTCVEQTLQLWLAHSDNPAMQTLSRGV